jgi:hypothetical protein
VKQDILRTETALENLRREVEGLDLEISYLTNPERLKSIYVNIGSPDKHLMGKDEIKALDELIPFYHFQYEKTASSFTVR